MIKSQYAGGILLQPVQKLVATLIFVRPPQGQKCKRVPSGVPKRGRDSNNQMRRGRGPDGGEHSFLSQGRNCKSGSATGTKTPNPFMGLGVYLCNITDFPDGAGRVVVLTARIPTALFPASLLYRSNPGCRRNSSAFFLPCPDFPAKRFCQT